MDLVAVFFLIVRDPIGEIDGAINVLDENDRFRTSVHQEPPKLGIGVSHSELKIIDIVTKEIGHSCDHARFACAWKAIEKVTSLPSPTSPLIESSPLGKFHQIIHDLCLSHGVHC